MNPEMKTSGFRFEMQHSAAEALRSLLSQVSTIKLKEIRQDSSAKGQTNSFVAHVDVFGRSHTLACHVRSSTERTNLRRSLLQLLEAAAQLSPQATPVLIASSLPPEAQAICKEFNAAFLDLEGNARLMLGETFIIRRSIPAEAPAGKQLKTRPPAPTVFIASSIPGPTPTVRTDTVAIVGIA
jgi:hypothetical protein